MTECHCLPPVGAINPRLLILGTMPGPVSLRKQEYYGHPQNAFWRIMGDLFGTDPALPYKTRIGILASYDIALFDTLQSCVRSGSADGDMRQQVPNDFSQFFERRMRVAHIFFDGAVAFATFRKVILPTLKCVPFQMTGLPSTSPRYASMTYLQKLIAWRAVQDVALQPAKAGYRQVGANS
jgi:double-stranded uracil-DNA glycosylase